jgi:glutathione S-transferase
MKIKLVYFNGRGLAEISRMLLALENVEYEDFRYPLEIIDWATYNMVKEEFEEDKKNGKLKYSMNKLPFLEISPVDDEKFIIPQSKTIERYLARKYNFMGNNDVEEAMIESICEYIRDFKTAYQPIRKSDNKEEEMQKWFSETLPEKLKNLEVLFSGEDGHAIGKKISLADVTIYSFLTDFFDDKDGSKKAYENCPKIQKIVSNLSENEKMKAWVESRPKTGF